MVLDTVLYERTWVRLVLVGLVLLEMELVLLLVPLLVLVPVVGVLVGA